MNQYFVHESAFIEEGVGFGENAKVWHNCHVRRNANIGKDVSLGMGVFIDCNVKIDEGCRIQNGVSIYQGVELSKWVFVGPNVTFTNDRYPRVGRKNWNMTSTLLMPGSSIGAGSIIASDLYIGSFSLVGAGSIVTESIPPFHLAYGLPAKPMSKICACTDVKMGLDAKKSELIQACCKKNLQDEVYQLALVERDKLSS